MTGFGATSCVTEIAGQPMRLGVELRSVNQRFLEVKIRQPFGAAAEHALRRKVEARLRRGRVDVYVHLQAALGAAALGPAELERVAEVLAQARQIEVHAQTIGSGALAPFTALDVLRLLAARSSGGERPFHRACRARRPRRSGPRCAVRHARAGGRGPRGALRELAGALQGHAEALQTARAGEAERLLTRLRERVAALCEKAGVSPPPAERLAQEVAALVQRGDIEEELARIDSHLGQLRSTLDAPAQVGQGKVLDFLAQELFRELTTIGSKITSHAGSALVIAAKGDVERIREQVQNVE
ncbi:endoribonuclease YicC domain-containing protein [Nannocystis pusilla]|uniref:endoribonuclease YicC domain-containing protein n=1 Tax=Nannocystis pusilla TaxID=889268 RepID=UPI003B76E3BA